MKAYYLFIHCGRKVPHPPFSENNPSGKASCISKDWPWKAMTSISVLSSLSVPAWEGKQDLQKEVASL